MGTPCFNIFTFWTCIMQDLMILVLAALISQGNGARYKNLGCYPVVESTPEVEGLIFHYANLDLERCAVGCQQEGYPYIALHNGQSCICSATYGRHNAIYGSACNITCHTDQTFSCGGMTSESVYYAIDTEQRVQDSRINVLHNENLTFEEARSSCVKNGGDLLTLRNSFELDGLVSLFNQSDVSDVVWIGAYMNSWDSDRKWVVPFMQCLDISRGSALWMSGQPQPGERCTAIDIERLQWVSSHCQETHPYVCQQLPPLLTETPMTEEPELSTIAPTDSNEDLFWHENKWMLLYIVLPIFIICYGGSCLYYTIYKIIEACRKKPPRTKRLKPKRPSSSFDRFSSKKAKDKMKLLNEENNERKWSSVTPRDVIVNENEALVKEAEVEEKKRLSDNGEFDRNEDEDRIDFTKLTLTEIRYIREMLGDITEKRTKKKKILSA